MDIHILIIKAIVMENTINDATIHGEEILFEAGMEIKLNNADVGPIIRDSAPTPFDLLPFLYRFNNKILYGCGYINGNIFTPIGEFKLRYCDEIENRRGFEMKKEEWNRKLNEIIEEKNEAIKKLNTEYALSNNHFEIGHIIRDHYQIIKIEKISVNSGLPGQYPSCTYTGKLYKKDLTPFKSGEISTMYQTNVKEVF